MTTRCRQVRKIPTAVYGLLFLDSAAVTEIDNGFITFCFLIRRIMGLHFEPILISNGSTSVLALVIYMVFHVIRGG